MNKNIKAVLWRIGSSVVFTVPADTLRQIRDADDGNVLLLTFKKQGESFKFFSKPWKCGGSHVATIPSSVVGVYGLMGDVKSKEPMSVNIKMAPNMSG
jgi:hypothetical protein